MDTLFIFGAKYLLILSIIIGAFWFIQEKILSKKVLFLFGFLSLTLSFVLAKLASLIYTDPRPFVVEHFTPLIAHTADNGFPSDHMLLVSAIASVVTYYDKKLGFALWIIAVLVGISRINVGVHHPIDILGSALIAILSTFITAFFLKKRRVI